MNFSSPKFFVRIFSGRYASYVRWGMVVISLEILSFATIFTSWPNTIAVCAVGVIIFWLAWKRPTIAMGAMILELLIGSKGYLLQFGGWPSSISLRIVMTGAFFAGWLLNFLLHGDIRDLVRRFKGREAYLFLFVLIAFATIRGVLLGNTFAMSDANAWADWALLFPVLDISWRYRKTIRKDIVPVFWVAIFWLAAETLILEYIFSHGFTLLSHPFYLWVRRTGVGEVTLMTANVFRIFMQSYVYAVAAWLVAVAWWMTRSTISTNVVGSRRYNLSIVYRTIKKPAWWVMTACTMIIVMSLSRSFWIGSFIGFVGLCVFLIVSKRMVWTRLWGPIFAGIAGIVALIAVLAFPIPPVPYANMVQLFGQRTNLSGAAAVSRWNLLPVLDKKIVEHPFLGSGFGATVTYKTDDPRILTDHPNGMYTTYAFEWGWLAHWVKFGILGIPLIAYLLFSLGFRIWKLKDPLWLRTGAVAALTALAVVHIFTPYLNHPLGFLYFFIGEGITLTAAARL